MRYRHSLQTTTQHLKPSRLLHDRERVNSFSTCSLPCLIELRYFENGDLIPGRRAVVGGKTHLMKN